MKSLLLAFVGVLIISPYLMLGWVQRAELVVPKTCITAVALKGAGECHGPDKDQMVCEGLVITYKPECASWRIVK